MIQPLVRTYAPLVWDFINHELIISPVSPFTRPDTHIMILMLSSPGPKAMQSQFVVTSKKMEIY